MAVSVLAVAPARLASLCPYSLLQAAQFLHRARTLLERLPSLFAQQDTLKNRRCARIPAEHKALDKSS